MKAGDIYHLELDPTKGHEQRGKRSVLIVSNDGYNKITGMPVVAPITGGGEFARIAGFTVSLTGCGLITSGVVRLDQLRAVDLKARGGKKIESIPPAVLDDVLNRVVALFESEKLPA